MKLKDEIAENLPSCPRCGAPARRIEYAYEWTFRYKDTPEEKPKHEARIECSNASNCYHTDFFDFPDSVHYRGYGGSKLPDIDYSQQWAYIDAEWTRLALSYSQRKAYRDSLEARRCECGRVPRKGWDFCPHCGRKVEQ